MHVVRKGRSIISVMFRRQKDVDRQKPDRMQLTW